MHNTSRPIALAASLLLAALGGCYPSNPHQLGNTLVVHGVVTDAGTQSPLAGVKVTLLSLDNFPSQTTDAQGYFQFTDVLQQQNLLVQFQLQGYQTVTVAVNPTVLADGGCACDGGVPSFPGFSSGVDGFIANVALVQVLTVPIAGVVYSGPTLAAGAQVALTTLTGTPVQQTKTGSDGSFSFAAVNEGSYELVVLPWDRDNDGLADTQFFQQEVDVTPNTASDLGHLAINLADVQKALVASSFVNLSRAYPITGAQLLAGVSGVLQSASGALFLTFGAEVDPTLTSFELVQLEGGGFSPPIALNVSWSHGAVATLTPASTLVASDVNSIGYQLRITALRFADGTVAIPASPTAWGTITFSVQTLPQPLANPTPALYLGNQITATDAATKAVVDANTVWLLDANGDFVFDTVQTANWSAGNPIQLQWPSVPGAVAYQLYMRNTTSPGNSATGTLDWVQQTNVVIEATDPNQSQTIVATNVSPWSLNLGSAAGPWAFGNHIQFAVTSQDALGFTAPIDASKVLDTSDTFGGLVTGVAVDPGGPVPFGVTTEYGDTFNKVVRVDFSEPILTSSVPTLTSLGPRVTVRSVLASGFSNNNGNPTSLDSANSAWLSLQLAEAGNCTEVLVARSAGDTLIDVRDASYFTVGATSDVAFFSPTGQFLAESDGVASINAAANQLTLSSALATGVALPLSSFACSLQGGTSTTVPLQVGTTLTVGNANPFAVGDAVIYYEPAGVAAPVVDVLHVTGVDTTAKNIVVAPAPSAGHTAASLLFPAPVFGSEQTLRPSQTLTLLHDVAGSATAQLFFAAPVSGLAVGDKLLIDADGFLRTTVDQAQVTVTAIAFAPTGTPAVYSVTASVPTSITLLHGQAKVIALGDTFGVTTTKDTSGNTPLDAHRDQFTIDGLLY